MVTLNAPIGVLDAGFGGYTVVKELQKIVPQERIVFYGDGKNQPYGNRSKEEIIYLTKQCLHFLQEKGVKAVAVGCNTISTLIDEYQTDFPFKIFSIVRAGSDALIQQHPSKVVMLSTMFTAQSGCYERYIHAECPDIEVVSQGSKWLARLIEDGDFNRDKIIEELKVSLGHVAELHPDADTLILGCTHFPLVKDIIIELYPQFTHFINPAAVQAQQIKEYLKNTDMLTNDGGGDLQVYTTSDCEVYTKMANSLGLRMTGPVKLAPAPATLVN